MSKVYEIITNQIIEKLEEGTNPFERPWDGMSMPRNYLSGKEYRGINTILLGLLPYNCPYYATFKQITNNLGQVIKGERSHMVVFWKWLDVKDDEDEIVKSIPFLRYYRVFNLEQTTGIPWEKLLEHEEEEKDRINRDPIVECESIVDNFTSCPEIRYGGSRAYYSPLQDYIQLPKQIDFKSMEYYYGTLFHEITHSSGHNIRLNRRGITDLNEFGSQEYSKEELVAEIGAAFLCGKTGIKNETIDNSAAYLNSWLRVLKEDSKMIIIAASQAQKAVDFITSQ